MNFMFLKDTGWCQNPLLIHFRRDTSSSKDLTPDQGIKSVSRADQFILWLICSNCQEDSQSVPAPASVHRDATTQLTLTSWFFPCFGGECRQLVGTDLCSLTCWSCKRIPLDLCQETYWSDTCSRAPAGTFCFGTSLLWARGSWVQCTGGMHRQALLPPPTAPSCSSQPKPWRAQEQEQSLLHGAGTSAVWWDVTRLRLKASKSWKAACWHLRHNKG